MAVRAYDTRPENVEASRRLVADQLRSAGLTSDSAAQLSERWVRLGDFLLTPDVVEADFIVGNPPYIRYDHLSTDLASSYRRAWPAMRGRGDIYVGFLERALALLKPEGRVAYICPDRWMRNQYGSALRNVVSTAYSVEHVWIMHDVDAFDRRVAAYPALTVISRRPQGAVVVAETSADFGFAESRSLVEWANAGALIEFEGRGVRAHQLPHWFEGVEPWPTGSPARLALIEHLNDNFSPLQDARTGTRVSIGVATGADGVYITTDPSVVEPDRVLPLATQRDLMSGTFAWNRTYLINPWADDGSLVDLRQYPRLASYLGQHATLRQRHVVKKNPDKWHRTIDKLRAGLLQEPKILIHDLNARMHPVLEPGGHYPHHNLYYITSDAWDLRVLGGLLLSRVAQAFVEAYGVRMRGGTLRFQSQYLKRIRVPEPDAIPDEIKDALRRAFESRDVDAATHAAAQAYGIELLVYELDRPAQPEQPL